MNGLRQLLQWFMGLERRERLVLAGGGVFLFLFIFYAGVINPYFHHKQTLKKQIQQQSALLAWMRPVAIQIESYHGAQTQSLPGGSLLSVVNNTVAAAGLGNALQQAQQAADGTVRAQFSGADFDSLVRWLDTLHKQYGISVADMSVTRGSDPGLVNVNLKLQDSTQ